MGWGGGGVWWEEGWGGGVRGEGEGGGENQTPIEARVKAMATVADKAAFHSPCSQALSLL